MSTVFLRVKEIQHLHNAISTGKNVYAPVAMLFVRRDITVSTCDPGPIGVRAATISEREDGGGESLQIYSPLGEKLNTIWKH